MGRLAIVLDVEVTERDGEKFYDIKVNPGPLDNVTAENLAPAGDDSPPLAGDYALLVESSGEGREVVAGYADTKNAKKSARGDKRVYARDSDGAQIAEVWIKNDGTIIISNSAGTFTLDTSGNITASGTITAAKFIAPSAEIGGVEVAAHIHAQANDSGGNVEQPTGPMI